jgi:TorA maturation chaperone TorD
VSTLKFSPSAADDSEELARAEVYGLLAALFNEAPAEDLYRQLQVAVTEAPAAGAFLEDSFGVLVQASRRLTLEAVEAEYDALFLGVGKPEVFLYSSYYIAGALNEAPLVELRDELRLLGLERDPALFVTEDHLACLCEVMRFLIAGDDLAVSNLATQQRFFNAHLRDWADALWEMLGAHPRADFYRAVAAFARDFFSVEGQAFDMLDL